MVRISDKGNSIDCFLGLGVSSHSSMVMCFVEVQGGSTGGFNA